MMIRIIDMSFHTIILVGNLGRDPEMRYTPSGQPVTMLSVAVDDSYKNGGEKVKRTIWLRVHAWGKLGEICNEYLRKGSKILVEGKLVADHKTGAPRIWERNDGSAGSSFEVRATTIRFLSSRSGQVEDVSDEEVEGVNEINEEVPF